MVHKEPKYEVNNLEVKADGRDVGEINLVEIEAMRRSLRKDIRECEKSLVVMQDESPWRGEVEHELSVLKGSLEKLEGIIDEVRI